MNTFKLIFLGTGAADFPHPFPKNSFDKKARRSSSTLLDDNNLIDCGIHTLESLDILGKNLSEIKNIFVTHTHPDHFIIDNIAKIASEKSKPLNLYVNKGAIINFKITNA